MTPKAERVETYRQFITSGGTPNVPPDLVDEVLAGLTDSLREAYIRRALRR